MNVQAGTAKFEAQLVWGTDDSQSPNPKHKPVEPAVRKKLNDLPLKYKNYFETNRKEFEISDASPSKVSLSEKCQLEVKALEGATVEVTLFGKGKEVMKRNQALPKGELLVLGGNAPNSTAWLVILKRVN